MYFTDFFAENTINSPLIDQTAASGGDSIERQVFLQIFSKNPENLLTTRRGFDILIKRLPGRRENGP